MRKRKKRSAHTSVSLLKQIRKRDFVGTVHDFVQTKYKTIRANTYSTTSLVSKTKREYTDYRKPPPSPLILICVKKENHKPYSDQLQWYAQSKYFYYKEKNDSAAHKSTHDGDKLTFF